MISSQRTSRTKSRAIIWALNLLYNPPVVIGGAFSTTQLHSGSDFGVKKRNSVPRFRPEAPIQKNYAFRLRSTNLESSKSRGLSSEA